MSATHGDSTTATAPPSPAAESVAQSTTLSNAAAAASPPSTGWNVALPSWQSLVAGGAAGAISRTIVSPLERVKLLFQMQGMPPKYTSTWQCIRVIWVQDGMYGYFRGNLANVIRITPTSAFQFFFYDFYKRLFFPHTEQLHPLQRLWAGGLAGSTACALTYPLDLVRARLTLQSGANAKYKGIVHGLQSVVRDEGFIALYRGLWPSLVGIFPYIGIDFMVYETLKSWLPHSPWARGENGDPRQHALLGCGAIAGVVGQTVAYPLDLVRRRLQVQGWSNETHYRYTGGILRTMRQIAKEEGVTGLYRGLIPNYYKVVPAVSISFVVYEAMKKWLDMPDSGAGT